MDFNRPRVRGWGAFNLNARRSRANPQVVKKKGRLPVFASMRAMVLAALCLLPAFTVQATSADNPSRLFNLSARGHVQTGDGVMIAGFILDGATSKTVV